MKRVPSLVWFFADLRDDDWICRSPDGIRGVRLRQGTFPDSIRATGLRLRQDGRKRVVCARAVQANDTRFQDATKPKQVRLWVKSCKIQPIGHIQQTLNQAFGVNQEPSVYKGR